MQCGCGNDTKHITCDALLLLTLHKGKRAIDTALILPAFAAEARMFLACLCCWAGCHTGQPVMSAVLAAWGEAVAVAEECWGACSREWPNV